jgi:putative N-acetylmannosamine-6-phosphate epimerase
MLPVTARLEVDAYKEKRPGVFWVMDMSTLNEVGYSGARYVNVIGDPGSGYADVMHSGRESDLTEASSRMP